MTGFRQIILALGAFNLALAVALGAFGAHALRERAIGLPLERGMAVWETAVQYHFIHGIGLILLPLIMHWLDGGLIRSSALLMLAGILFFSGSLYLMTLTGWRWLGPITPLGGLCFIAAWLLLAVAALRHGA